MKQSGLQVISDALTSRQTSAVKLRIFQSDGKKVKNGMKKVTLGKSDEIAALLRITQIIGIGTPDISESTGRHECNNKRPDWCLFGRLLFDEDVMCA